MKFLGCLRALIAITRPGRWESAAGAGLGDVSLLGLSHGGNSAWKGGVRHSKSSPGHQSTNPVFLSPASPFFLIIAWELQTLSPEQPPTSQEHQRLLQPSLPTGFWGLVLGFRGSHHASEVLMGMRERGLKWP